MASRYTSLSPLLLNQLVRKNWNCGRDVIVTTTRTSFVTEIQQGWDARHGSWLPEKAQEVDLQGHHTESRDWPLQGTGRLPSFV